MECYETELMDKDEFAEFCEFFDKYIGTDYEVNDDPEGSDKVYIMVFDLTVSEVRSLREFENRNS
jgi:hypothetical protein